MSRIVLFGAGASHGSEDVQPTPPPLGKYLFDALVAQGGQAATLPDDLKNKFRVNFEEGMAAYHKQAKGDVMRFQRELAKFVAQFVPGPRNAYTRLFNKIDPTRHLFCTLNYDMLIELSVGSLKIHTAYATGPRDPRALRLLKLHGSCNFWPRPGLITGSCNIELMETAIDGDPYIFSRKQTLQLCETELTAPAIAMYAEGKQVKVFPSFVQNQQLMYSDAVKDAMRICVVGAAINLKDEHIWNHLSSTPASVHYFGRKTDEEPFLAWKDLCGKKNLFFIESDFADAVDTIAACIERT